MFGLNIVVTSLFNILVVEGKMFLQQEYLKDGDHFEHYQSAYSVYPRSDYYGNVRKSNFDAWKPKVVAQYRPGFNFGAPMPSLFPAPDTGDLNLDLPVGSRYLGSNWDLGLLPDPVGPGRNGYPSLRKPTRNGRSRMCKNIKGLPTPESGCCGVQLSKYPAEQQYPFPSQYPGYPSWSGSESESEDERFRRSINTHKAPNKMIRGGRATDLHQLPWMARLAINSRFPGLHGPAGCGGTIISSRYILTAAHCLHNTYKDLSQLDVFLAEYDTDHFAEDCIKRDGKKKCIKNKVMKVEHVIIHKDYNDTYLQNDVALLRLTSDIPYTPFIRPICLPPVDVQELEDMNFIIAGWGLNGKQECNLKQAAVVNYVANDKCKEHYPYKDASLFCSIGDHGEDICHGDSGGPLMVAIDGKYYLSGVVNGKRLDHECGSSVPSLFNNVFYHRDWIMKHVR